MKFLCSIGLCLFLVFSTHTFALEQQYHPQISAIIAAFKNNDKAAISSHIRYPFTRFYPVPTINNEAELINRFDEVFDEQLIAEIASSDVDTDWEKVGWRGIMLNSGLVWTNTDGKIIGINYQTDKEQQLAKDLIAEDKQALHSSINTFEEPVLDWQTANYHIRVDDMGDNHYRYSAWSIDKKPSDKPDLVLYNGDIKFEGTGGNHHYEFKNGRYRYIISVTVIGCDDSSIGWLEVLKGDKRILFQDVIKAKGE